MAKQVDELLERAEAAIADLINGRPSVPARHSKILEDLRKLRSVRRKKKAERHG